MGELGVAPDDLLVPGAVVERGVDGVAPGVRPVEPLGQVVDGQTVGPSSSIAGDMKHGPANFKVSVKFRANFHKILRRIFSNQTA